MSDEDQAGESGADPAKRSVRMHPLPVLAILGIVCALGFWGYASLAGLLFEAPPEQPSPYIDWMVIDPADAGLVVEGRKVYEAQCAGCHGFALEGQPDWQLRGPDGLLPAPPHDETGHTWHHPDAILFATVKLGGQVFMPKGVKSGMPAFGGELSDREIKASLAYIKSRWPRNIRRQQAARNLQAQPIKR